MDDGTSEILAGILITFIYFVPAIVAWSCNKKSAVTISLVSIFTGWTIIGWIVTFIWACASPIKGDTRNLIPCVGCGRLISRNAKTCPGCGEPNV